MANGAGRLFNVMKQTSEGTNNLSSQVVSLTVKSIQPLIFNRDDRLDIPEELCVFDKNLTNASFNINDKVTAFIFNNGQTYFIYQNTSVEDVIDYNSLSNRPEINNIVLENNIPLPQFNVQKILWESSAGALLGANETITLSEKITDQLNGIVLVWCRYNTTLQEAGNYAWNFNFIPKQMIALNVNATGYNCIMSAVNFSSIGTKYIYLSDTTIAGNAYNLSTSTSSGITYNNGEFCLRYVLGV